MGFLEIANGGTLLLTNIERLPSAIQCELAEFYGSGKFERPGTKIQIKADVKIIAASELASQELKKDFLHPDLYAILEKNQIHIPILAERKRDFPILIEHLLNKISRKNNFEKLDISSGAMELLISYDYPNNVDELENILERAAVMAEGGTILSEHIILGIPRSGYKHRFNLLHLPSLLRFLRSKLYPNFLQLFTGGFLIVIIVFSFWGQDSIVSNLANLSVWSIWWPSLIIFTFFAARWWCGICPISALSVAGDRANKKHIKASDFLKRYGLYIMCGGMVLIVWFEEVFEMRHSPMATGLLISSIGAGALISGMFLGRYSWCSNVCPLGGMLGVLSKASILELRTNVNICTNQCKTHACYKGNGFNGCPMLQHPLSLDTNQKCKMCFKCLKNCPHRSIRLDLRPAGEELWAAKQNERGAALFSITLAALLFPLILNKHGEVNFLINQKAALDSLGRAFAFGVIIVLSIGVVYGLFKLASRFSEDSKGKYASLANQTRYAQGFIPLALGGHAAYQVSQLPLGDKFSLQLGLQTQPLFKFNLLEIMLFLLIFGGIGCTFYVFWKIYTLKKEELKNVSFLRTAGGFATLAFVLGCIYFALFLI
jgi:polyferredoxin